MRSYLLLLISALCLTAPAQAGTFNVIESDPSQPRVEREQPTVEHSLPPVRVGDTSTRYTVLPYEMVQANWSAQVRAVGRSSCYVEVHWLNGDGERVGWSNANVVIARNSNGFATARGETYLGQREAGTITRSETTAQCY